MTDPIRQDRDRTLIHPAVLAALWDYGPKWPTVSAAYQRWKAPDGPRIVVLDSIRRDVLDRLRRNMVGWPLDSQIAALLAEDVTEALSKLVAQQNVESIPTAPLLASAFVLATSLKVDMDDAMCLFVASATGEDLLLLDRPDPAMLARILPRFPGLKYSTLT